MKSPNLKALLSRGIVIGVLAVVFAGPSGSAATVTAAANQLTAEDYGRAERFLFWNRDKYLINGGVQHHWIQGQDRFWYRRTVSPGVTQFVVVEAASGRRSPAFDHDRVAAALTSALSSSAEAGGARKSVEAGKLPFNYFRYADQGKAIEFLVGSSFWTCRLDREACWSSAPPPQAAPDSVVSPDGRWAAFLKGYDLWVRATDGSTEFALTTDGVEHYSYAGSPGNNVHTVSTVRSGKPVRPVVLWSPDSRHLLTHRIDERLVKEVTLVQSTPPDGSVRPKVFTYRYAMANDEHKALVQQLVLDVVTHQRVALDFPAAAAPYVSPLEAYESWWSNDGQQVNYIERGPYYRTIAFKVADAATGKSRTLIEESSKTYIEVAGVARRPMVHRLSNGSFIWFSERDGWGHLYLYDRNGRLKNQITHGNWVVRGIAHVDEPNNWIYFTASGREAGRNAYYRHLYRVRLDGSGLKLLTPENAEHVVGITGDNVFNMTPPDPLGDEPETFGFSPSGRYFVDVHSRPDQPGASLLRAADGRLIATLEAADISRLAQGGFTMPEPFEAVAADGKTAIFGTILRPSHFDPAKRYPVLDSIYPGPQINRVWRDFALTVFDPMGASSLAELGFIVVTLDGRGTPLRSKAFVDESYGKLGEAGNLEDHLAVLRQLAIRYPSLDLDHVGIFGSSGGGYAAAHAILKYPDFYKVAVAGAGNHDQRGYIAVWGESYNGPEAGRNYLDAANASLAANLRGKLLLVHGELDDNVHPAQTLQVVDALIRANKDFDMLIVPNAAHGVMLDPYVVRRQWDYFVRNLMEARPPADYRIGVSAAAGKK